MKRTSIILTLLLTVLPLSAQTDDPQDPEFGGRLSVRLDKKATKGLHLYLEEEVRMDNNFGAFERLHTSAGATYKVIPSLKLGAGYALINPYSTKNAAFKNARHRLMLDAAYTYRHGDWYFSLKERMQATFRTGDYNPYQNPQPALTLKSRLQAKYKGFGRVVPYGYVELRHILNAPAIMANYDGSDYYDDNGSETGDAGWFISGWDKAYCNRVRTSLGADIRLDRHNTLTLYLLADYVNNYEVDANASGTKLKSYTHETGFLGYIGATYRLSF